MVCVQVILQLAVAVEGPLGSSYRAQEAFDDVLNQFSGTQTNSSTSILRDKSDFRLNGHAKALSRRREGRFDAPVSKLLRPEQSARVSRRNAVGRREGRMCSTCAAHNPQKKKKK